MLPHTLQPAPRYKVFGGLKVFSLPNALYCSFIASTMAASGLYDTMQSRQIFLTNLWAMMRVVTAATRNGGIPMSISRGMAAEALLVWRVERSKEPVSAASGLICV